ncbi:SDR family NAD(P)-dependent oxidoreductase [Alginatibacterium sediminis]|uniref:SDR family NAD(P)-dependent oxidoreductase n=1 Tax=Alginatibacterium sediminis TaxID=2164068 RepID=A0A420ELA6_9ALTE|nr:SDR family NAD(P)-dependent oxidoreductase [Alginatibacterium sediminis]RKF21521.1 SDR family NAD(P)-dependent oxidoreductase [Alginatibacterium sediminis]
MNVDLSNKWALVTGASRGVGLRIAKGLAHQGCKLILHARDAKSCDELAQELKSQGCTVAQVGAELSDNKQVEALITQVNTITQHNLEVLYCNAAIMTPWSEPFKQQAQDYALSFQVNCIAPAKLADAFIPQMLNSGFGRVVMMTSGIADQPQLMAYSCSKAAIDRYVRDMVSTLEGSDVLINLADPGWLTTDLGGPDAPNHPDSVLPGVLVPVVIEKAKGSGGFYAVQELKDYPL